MRKNWQNRIGYATAAWSFVYGLFGLYWTFGGKGFPFGPGDQEFADEGNLMNYLVVLSKIQPESAGPVIAGIGLTGAVLGVLMALGKGRGIVRNTMLVFAGVLAIGLTVVIQDYRSLILVAYTPIVLISIPIFHWPAGIGFGDLYQWPRVNLLLCLLAGIGWALTAFAYHRSTSDASGRTAEASNDRLQKWAKPAVAVAIIVPLIYAATRWAWALGWGIGLDPEYFREGQESGLWIAGATLATMAALGGVLTLGLIQRWGEVFPRWMIGLRGKRVPPMLAVVPATLVAVLVTSAGGMYIRIAIGTGIGKTWVTNMPETLWPIWGAALFVAAMAYHQRRRNASPTT